MSTTQSPTEPADLARPFPWPQPPIDPPAAYAWLRRERPVTRVLQADGQPVWLITRYDDVKAILSDPRVLSDHRLPGNPRFGVPYQEPDWSADITFHRSDPPYHTTYRKILAPHFSARRVRQMRPEIEQLVEGLLDELLARPDRQADLVADLALPVPSVVLSRILGVPPESREFFNRATDEMMKGLTPDPDDHEQQARGQQAALDLQSFFGRMATERDQLDDPGDDILGDLVKAMRAGEVTPSGVAGTGMTLLVAGHDTTAGMVSMGTFALLQHRDQLAELRADPALIPGAIEELLRYLTIVNLIVARIAGEDIEIGGVTIPEGEGILPLISSADRDEAHYPDADRLDIHRPARDNLALGHGIHHCIGAALARLELEVVFEALLRRVPTLRLAVPPEQIEFKVTSPINGIRSLPVTW